MSKPPVVPNDQCDRAALVVQRAVNCGWIKATAVGLEQLRETIRIALDMEVAAGGPFVCKDGLVKSAARYAEIVAQGGHGALAAKVGRALTQEEWQALKRETGKDRSRTRRFVLDQGEKGEFIDDDEFTYDALLRVHGDFETAEAKRAYMQAVCDVLNEHEDRIPHRQLTNAASREVQHNECSCSGGCKGQGRLPEGTYCQRLGAPR